VSAGNGPVPAVAAAAKKAAAAEAAISDDAVPGPTAGPVISPYRISVSEDVLEDLRHRLGHTRWPNEIEGSGWSYGLSLPYLRGLVAYWKDHYDWRRHERFLNEFDQFTTTIDDQRIHFFHIRSEDPRAIPVLLLHGWPSSAAEFARVFRPLTEPAKHGGSAVDSFHVVAPSLPGHGFSGPTSRPGWGPRRMAHASAELMSALGYDHFGVQGGDMGSAVAMNLADAYPDRVIGLHMNYAPDMRSRERWVTMSLPESLQWESLTPAERQGMVAGSALRDTIMGWHEVKSKEPQSLGYMLEDSPVALASCMLWSAGEQKALTRELHFTRDGLLDFVTTTWVTATGTSSCRCYYELNQRIRENVPRSYISVPTGIAVYPGEQLTPRRWVEHGYNVTYWSQPPRGGHFAATEAPDVFTGDLRKFFGSLRTSVQLP
jgi:microsomal epoxide hydrolase